MAPEILKVTGLDDAGLVHGFSTLELGSVGLTHAPDRQAVLQSRRRFASDLGLDPASLTAVGAVHGADVARVDTPQDAVPDVDALITDRPGVALFATYADCYPILLWDPEHRAAGLVHAGWRGTEGGITAEAVRAMVREFGSDPARVKAAIGPGICVRCYEVGEEVAARFDPRFVRESTGGKSLLDLAAANRAQLEREGVGEILALDLCTKETGFLPSHRRAPDGTRFGAIVAIR
jgi:purine-nucleoside/S-methyl-5'-thioadenosine phosphorylase / adenosine deaminase